MCSSLLSCYIFFFNETAPTEIYTFPLHDPLPIWRPRPRRPPHCLRSSRRSSFPCRPSSASRRRAASCSPCVRDRKSTRLNSSHANISYAVFCLKKKNGQETIDATGMQKKYHSELA